MFNEKEFVYVFSHLYAFGELPDQIWSLINIFPAKKITIITYPLQKLNINKSLYKLTMRGLNIIHTTDNDIIWFCTDLKNKKIIEDDKYIFINLDINQLKNFFCRRFINKENIKNFELNHIEIKMGENLRHSFNIPRDKPIVTLHVRESGYKGTLYNQQEGNDGPPRNANIDNYIPAIKYLIDKGYTVVRLGDKTMKPLPKIKYLIDAPFHKSYNNMVDVYFIAQSKFYIGTSSGPYAIAKTFGIPKLCTNFLMFENLLSWKHDLYIFKKYFSIKENRCLSYEEILYSDILTDYTQQTKIKLVENSPLEILSAVKEMLARLNNKYFSMDEMKTINNYFINIQNKAFKFYGQTFKPIFQFFDNKKAPPISLEYIRINPFMLNQFNTDNIQKNLIDKYDTSATHTTNLKSLSTREKLYIEKLKKLIQPYNRTSSFQRHKPHLNILLSTANINYIFTLFNNIENLYYEKEEYTNSIDKLPFKFYETRQNILKSTKFDEDAIVAFRINLLYFILKEKTNESLKKIINQFGYRIISIINDPVKVICEWNQLKSENIPESMITDDNLHPIWKETNFPTNDKIERQAIIWELYAKLYWDLRYIIKIYSVEQFAHNSEMVIEDICNYLSLPYPKDISNISFKDENYTESLNFDKISKAVQKFCPTRFNFGYEKNDVPGIWDNHPVVFCRSVPHI